MESKGTVKRLQIYGLPTANKLNPIAPLVYKEDGSLSVDITNVAEEGNPNPISSDGVYRILGNISNMLDLV